jgi:multiple sugar transport system ATP-binding protein
MATIEIDHVTKVFGNGVVAVDDVSLAIGDGEFLVLVGPSGCGKSTLLRMLAGLEEVTEGAIRIDGTDVTELAPRHRDIAMVFQSYALYPHMTVRENLGYGLKVRRAPKQESRERVAEVARLLGLEELLDRKPAQLSGGQRQRVAMGRAIVRKCVPDGRAPLEPRRKAAGRDAGVPRAAPREARGHDRVRDPRPDGGDDPGAAGRGPP